jgi:hypothetical protein
VEPLAFALGANGHHGIHKRVLERLIEERHWRNADSTRILEYYGTVGVKIAAILRHWRDPFRTGLLRVKMAHASWTFCCRQTRHFPRLQRGKQLSIFSTSTLSP